MAAKIPKSKPQGTRAFVEKILKFYNVDLDKTPLVLLGVRGYYLDSIGEKGKNDRGDYDDAFFWITKDSLISFNGNTDPSRYRKGRGKGSGKGMASLKEGVWLYKTGIHNGVSPHAAFRQAADVIVVRDGLDGDYEEKGQFGINIHRGGVVGTSSLGCQTVPPSQWPAFKELGYLKVKQLNLSKFVYLLTSETTLRKNKLSTVS